MPSARAASSSSRIARSTRPHGVLWTESARNIRSDRRPRPDDEEEREAASGPSVQPRSGDPALDRVRDASPSRRRSRTVALVAAGQARARSARRGGSSPRRRSSRSRSSRRAGAATAGRRCRPKPIVIEDRDRQREPEREAVVDDQDRHRVGADRHEAGLAEVDDPGEADVELQAQREDRVDAGEDPDADPEADVGERIEGDRERQGWRVDSSRSRPSSPCRRCPAAGRSGRGSGRRSRPPSSTARR